MSDDVERLAKALQQAVVDEPWYETDEQRPVEDFCDEYARRVASAILARLPAAAE